MDFKGSDWFTEPENRCARSAQKAFGSEQSRGAALHRPDQRSNGPGTPLGNSGAKGGSQLWVQETVYSCIIYYYCHLLSLLTTSAHPWTLLSLRNHHCSDMVFHTPCVGWN